MNERVKKLWLDALRSGQYKQVKEMLTDGKGFCCLGVLCNLHSLETEGSWEQRHDTLYYKNNSETLPDVVIEWAGLDSTNPDIIYKKEDTSLADLNDKGKRFSTIAKLIEVQL